MLPQAIETEVVERPELRIGAALCQQPEGRGKITYSRPIAKTVVGLTETPECVDLSVETKLYVCARKVAGYDFNVIVTWTEVAFWSLLDLAVYPSSTFHRWASKR